MRGTIAIALTLVLAGFMPMATGFHLSAGFNDAVGVSSEEDPTDPTVPLDRQDVGLELPSTCYEADGNVTGTDGSLTEAPSTDDFCGELVYNELEELDAFLQPRPGDWEDDTLDQDLRSFSMADGTEVSISQFDVVQAQEAGAAYYSDGFSTCFVPGTGPAYKDAHDIGNDAGLTEDGETVAEKEPADEQNPCDIYVGAQLSYPNAGQLINENVGVMDMNGWMMPGKTKFIGFLTADIGDQQDVVVDDHVLEAIVEGEEDAGFDLDGDGTLSDNGAEGADGGLPEGAIAKVCGFFPAEGNKGTLEAKCDIEFKWIGPQEDPDDDQPPLSSSDYHDWCAARAYMCGTQTPAWYSEFLSSAVGGHLVNQFLVQEHSTTGYDIFHWVAAPTQSACDGDQEPGFLFSTGPDSLADAPYMAHDLDVYTTPSTAAGVDSVGHTDEAANAVVNQTTGDPLSQAPDLPDEVNDALSTAVNATYYTWKDRALEPNAPGDTSQLSLSDTYVDSDGNVIEELVREAAEGSSLSDCEILRGASGGGGEDVADPWVPYIDSRTTKDVNTDPQQFGTAIGPYNDPSFDQQQDAFNRGDPHQYFHFGEMGMTNDLNDGGGYGFPGTVSLLDSTDQRYPLFWDMWVDVDESTGEVTIDEEAGCSYTGTDLNGQLPKEMKRAGYGQHTGLIQAMYLAEPSYQFNFVSTNTFPFLGDNVIVTLSANYIEILRQGLGEDPTDPTDDLEGDIENSVATVRGLIDQTLERIPVDSGYGDGTFKWRPEGVSSGGGTVDDKVEVMSVEHDRSVDLDYSAQCDFPWFGWQNLWSFGPHACGTPETSAALCAGDTVVTHYAMEVTDEGEFSDTIGTSTGIPAFKPDGDNVFEFGTGIHSMFDVDPFDNDRSRNIDEDTDPCTPDDFEVGDRIECPHKVSGVENTGTTISWDGVIEETEIQERRDGLGSIHYVVEAKDSNGDVVDRVVDTDGDHEATLDITAGTEVSVTVQAVYNFGTDILPDEPGFQPASYDRAGPVSDVLGFTA